jgi:hypothetical protein
MKSSTELLRDALRVWSEIFGRKSMSEGVVQQWMVIFDKYPALLLAKAIDLVSRTAERMPTPGHLSKALNEIKASLPAVASRREAKQNCSRCHGTGFRIEERTGIGLPYTPRVAVPCECRSKETSEVQYGYRRVVARDSETGADVDAIVYDGDPETTCFRAVDCPEGRTFLNMLASWQEKQEPFPTIRNQNDARIERNRQKAEWLERVLA